MGARSPSLGQSLHVRTFSSQEQQLYRGGLGNPWVQPSSDREKKGEKKAISSNSKIIRVGREETRRVKIERANE